jgi:hypothetical protein
MSARRQFDRWLMKPLGWQILSLLAGGFAVALVLSGLVAWALPEGPSAWPRPLPPHWAFWWILSHLIDTGVCITGTVGWKERLFAVSASLTGLGMFTGMLVCLFVHAYDERVMAAREGRARYRFRDHLVLVGWSGFAPHLLRHLWRDGARRGAVVVLTSQPAETVRRAVRAHLRDARGLEAALCVYRGADDAGEDLRSLDLAAAREAYILGDPGATGAENLETALRVARAVAGARPGPLPCAVHLPTPRAFRLLQDFDLPESLRRGLHLRPFSIADHWARRALEARPLIRRGAGGGWRAPRLVLIGYTDVAEALLLQALRIAHHDGDELTRVTVVDPAAEAARRRFAAAYPEAEQIEDVAVEFVPADDADPALRADLEGWALDPAVHLTVALCYDDPEEALTAARDLPREVAARGVPVLVRQRGPAGFARLAEGEAAEDARPGRGPLWFFGMESAVCPRLEEQDALARALHAAYLEQRTRDGTFDETAPACRRWEDLPESFRWANRHQADHLWVKARIIGCTIGPADAAGAPPHEPDAREVEILARAEHLRWMADRRLAGWRAGPARDDARKITPHLVPYDRLEEPVKAYDRDAVRQGFAALARIGLAARKDAP